MPISQTTITGSVKTPDNSDAQITAVSFALSGSDYEAGEIIAKNSVSAAVTPEAGDFTVTLWPNDRGINGDTTYEMKFSFSDGSSVTGLRNIYVKHSDTPKTIEDVAFETIAAGKVKPMALVVLTQSQYDAMAQKAENTAYLIRG